MHVQDPSATSGLTMVTKDIASTGNLIRDYEKFVTGLFKTQVDNPEWNMAHAALGIGGESGEVVDLIKKTFVLSVCTDETHWHYNRPSLGR
jgi:hypothetical protein